MAFVQFLQRSLLTSPCLYSPQHRPVLQCSLTNALSSGTPGKQFRAPYRRLQTAENVESNQRPPQVKLKASSKDNAQLDQLDSATKWVLNFAASNSLPLILLAGVLVGLAYPRPGQIMQQWGLSRWATSGIFLISGLTLQTGDIIKAANAWPAALFGVVSVLFITPLAAIPILRLQLTPRELVTGLAIFCCVPTTLSSGVSLTQLVGANTALALALTITTNLIGIVTMPFVLSSLVGGTVGISIPARPLLKALVKTLLLPLLLGKLVRELSGFGNLIDKNKRNFSLASSFLLSLVPWMQTSCSRAMLLQVDPVQLLAAIVCGLCLHGFYLAWNSAVMCILPAYWGNEGGDQVSAARAIILVASQKTLPVLVAVVAKLNGTLGEAGLLVLPCIATHLSQIICDSILVSFWLDGDKSSKIATA